MLVVTKKYLLNEPLVLQYSIELQHLKIIFLVCCMLVNNEEIRSETRDNESQVKLAQYFHLSKN